ncbi:MAG: inositol monophosphatase family protein [Candidatus Magasanikbacteria bacterium]|nr:inositol monophosphatase family protein [Candidatus Magasanikbacteria bacterium]
MQIKYLKKIAVQAAKLAGENLMEKFKKFDRGTTEFKAHHEIVTKADLASEKIILKLIKNNFPGHQILSEESGDNHKQSDYLWIIDPLDGTTNFSMHHPLFSISIGVAFKGEIVLGVVYSPYLNELFVAEKGKGATMNNKKIKVSKIGKKDKALNTFCHGRNNSDIEISLDYMRYQKLHGFDCRQIGSAAIELAHIACGRIESSVIPGANPWDVAAGVLLVREAGGKVTDFAGKKWTIKSYGMAASNGLVQGEILRVLKNVNKE